MAERAERVTRGARVSECGSYRYDLTRRWGNGPTATFVMLNPSTADDTVDDRTIGRCMTFAQREGCSGLVVVNLYAYRATRPIDLWRVVDPVGPENDDSIRNRTSTCGLVIAAWGAQREPERVAQVRDLIGARAICALGLTKDGAPRHPLYVRGDAALVPM